MQKANTCEAFLVAGAARTIRPLPGNQGIYNATPAFRINDAHAYQVDFCEAPKDTNSTAKIADPMEYLVMTHLASSYVSLARHQMSLYQVCGLVMAA